MNIRIQKYYERFRAIFQNHDQRMSLANDIKNFCVALLRIVILLGVSYVILAPMIGIVVNSLSSDRDAYDPMVYLLPRAPTWERYRLALKRLDYFPTMARDMLYTVSLTGIQIIICSMTGYGFARFTFPLKKLLFGCVVVMIVIPSHTIMLPLYLTFKDFDPLGLVSLIAGGPVNLMGTPIPMYLMTVLGCGVRSGLYIYIFNQFFRGLPKEIEEAAFVDGAGAWYTYLRIMLPNAMPSVITVTVFSLVWQFNDTFYAKLFLISDNIVISKKISTLAAMIANQDRVLDTAIQELYVDAGIVLAVLPVVLIYLLLQRHFIEGVERSGIVG